jgi:hypothetical protein
MALVPLRLSRCGVPAGALGCEVGGLVLFVGRGGVVVVMDGDRKTALCGVVVLLPRRAVSLVRRRSYFS